MARQTTGGELLARLLANEGIDTAIGLVDASVHELVAGLADHDIALVTPDSDAAAVHMAAAWAHVRGGLGVAIAAAGSGLAQALPGLAATRGSGRVLLITSSRRRDVTGPVRPGTAAGLDQVAATTALTTWAARVPSVERLPELFREAVRMAWHRGSGVVHLDVPESILNGPAVVESTDVRPVTGAAMTWRHGPGAAELERIADRLVRARMPVVHIGHGVVASGAEDEVRELVHVLDAVATTTWPARGVIDEGDAHVIAPIHPGVVDDVRNEADVVLVLGTDLGESDWWGQPPHWAPTDELAVIQVDIDGAAVGRHRPVEVGVVGDIRTVVASLLEAIASFGPRDTTARRHWLSDHRSAVRRRRAVLDEPLGLVDVGPVHPAIVATVADQVMPPDTIWVLDGRHTRRWGQFHLRPTRPRSMFTGGPLELDGIGLAQAVGARLAAPHRQVCCLVGDQVLLRQLGGLAHAVRDAIDIVVVALVDDVVGVPDDAGGGNGNEPDTDRAPRDPRRKLLEAVTQVDEPPLAAPVPAPRFDRVAESLGAWGVRVGHPGELADALQRARDVAGPAVVHVSVDHVEHPWTPEAGHFRAQRTPDGVPRV